MENITTKLRRVVAKTCHVIGNHIDIHETCTAIIFFRDARKLESHELFMVQSTEDVPAQYWEDFHIQALCGESGFAQPAIYISHIETNAQRRVGTIKYSLNYENRHSVFYDYHGTHIRLNDFIEDLYEIKLDNDRLRGIMETLDGIINALTDRPALSAA